MSASSLQKTIDTISSNARKAASQLVDVSLRNLDECLREMARLLDANRARLKKENTKDCAAALNKKLSPAMIERLTLSDKTFDSMIKGLLEVADLTSSVGAIFDERKRPNGLLIYKTRVPIGVIGIIYESRPNVTVDAAALCLKARNAVILRGGSEAFHTNMALARLFSRALARCSLPSKAVQLIPTTDRAAIDLLLAKSEDVDLIIPRGGESLIRAVVEKSRIPVIKHYKGVCHVYISKYADMKIALPIVVNAKVQRPGVCNAMETLLIDSKLSTGKKKSIIDALVDKNVTIFGDEATRKLYPRSPRMKRATQADWYAEYLDLRLSVRIVDGVSGAVDHINTYGSRHTDAIVTESKSEAALFCKLVDSSSVMVNASTRFSDGGEYGLGCEIGISTDKLHARGPMGIDELTTYKWIVEGNGQIRT
jgi:glutamate-5-semialdehyde dehydrogenase